MATEAEITQALQILAGARLRNAPGREEAPGVKITWLRIMRDVPGEILLTATDEIILAGDFWPTPAEMRRAAAEVKAHNGKGRSTAFDPAYVRPQSEFARMPEAYRREHDRLKQRGTIPTDDELYRLEQLSGRIEA